MWQCAINYVNENLIQFKLTSIADSFKKKSNLKRNRKIK